MSNVIPLSRDSLGRSRTPYVDWDAISRVSAQRSGGGWPVMPEGVEVVQYADGRLTVQAIADDEAVHAATPSPPADAPSLITWERTRARGWRGLVARLFGGR